MHPSFAAFLPALAVSFAFLSPSSLALADSGWLPNPCGRLEFTLVEPESPAHPPTVSCRRPHSQECKVKQGFARFGRTTLSNGTVALRLKTASPNRMQQGYLNVLKNSPLLNEVSFLRIQARQISGKAATCEPLLVYLGDESIFQTGPVFVNGYRFLLNNQVYSNFISGEDVRHPLLPTVDAISKASLLLKGYFDPVFAHESAHGLMQDLYGVEEFRDLEERYMVSTAGHFEGAVTDPATALVEGFAEAFESYLGEKYIRPQVLSDVPDLDRLAGNAEHRLNLWTQVGAWNMARFYGGIPSTLLQFYRTLISTDELITDWLKLHRQAPIRNGTYLYQGAYAAFARHYGILMSNPLNTELESEIDAVVNGEPINSESVYSKEGVVAYVIYAILKEGLARKLFEVMAERKPTNLHELMISFLPRLTQPEEARIHSVLVSVFNPGARSEWVRILSSTESIPAGPARSRRAQELLASPWLAQIPASGRSLPTRLLPPRDLWIEFETSPAVAWWQEVFGRERVLNRINFATASFSDIYNFVDTIDFSVLRNSATVIFAIQQVLRENPQISTLEQLISGLRTFVLTQSRLPRGRSLPNLMDLETSLESFVYPKLREARACFNTRCLSH